MWHTPNGDRKLTGAEAQAVRASIGFMIDTLECEGKELAEPWMFDIPVFDNLSWQQRIALLARVGGSLLQDESPPPELTAVNEAAVGAIYENLRHCLQFEIESGDPDVTEDYTEDRPDILAATGPRGYRGGCQTGGLERFRLSTAERGLSRPRRMGLLCGNPGELYPLGRRLAQRWSIHGRSSRGKSTAQRVSRHTRRLLYSHST